MAAWCAPVCGALLLAALAVALPGATVLAEPPPPGPAARGGPSETARYPIHATKFITRYPEPWANLPPTLEMLNKPRPYDLDPAQGIFTDDFVLWTVDDLGNHLPEYQEFARLTGRQLDNGDYHLVVHLREAPGITDFFFYVRYHAERYHPWQIKPGSAFGFEGDRLWISREDVPGIVCGGMTRVRPDKQGPIKLADGVICEIVFSNIPFEHKPNWLERAPNGEHNRPREFTAYHEPETGRLVLYWEEANAGDFNNDGEVAAVDLIPVGRRYGRVSTDAHEDDWDWMADGNRDGEVNYRDAWQIGQNYGALLSGYRVYRRENGQPRNREVLLPHNTSPVLPMSIHRPVDWDPVRINEYRFVDNSAELGRTPREWVYRIIPYNAVDDIEGEGSALEVIVRASRTSVSVRPYSGR